MKNQNYKSPFESSLSILDTEEEPWEAPDSLGGTIWDEEPTLDIDRFRREIGPIEGSVSY
jgi:hypothetical protein